MERRGYIVDLWKLMFFVRILNYICLFNIFFVNNYYILKYCSCLEVGNIVYIMFGVFFINFSMKIGYYFLLYW